MPTLTDAAKRVEDIELWSQYPREVMIEKRRELGRAFRSGYQQEAMDDAEKTFPSWDRVKHYGMDPFSIAAPQWPRYTGVDLASHQRTGNAIITVAMNPETLLKVPVDLRLGAWSSPDTWRQIEDVYKKLKPTVIMVENVAYQDAIMDWGLERTKLPVRGFMTGRQKSDPFVGLPSIEVEFSVGAWLVCLPLHEVDCVCPWCVMDLEFGRHPSYISDDIVMALWFAREGTRFGRPIPRGVREGVTEPTRSRWTSPNSGPGGSKWISPRGR